MNTTFLHPLGLAFARCTQHLTQQLLNKSYGIRVPQYIVCQIHGSKNDQSGSNLCRTQMPQDTSEPRPQHLHRRLAGPPSSSDVQHTQRLPKRHCFSKLAARQRLWPCTLVHCCELSHAFSSPNSSTLFTISQMNISETSEMHLPI